MTFQNAFRLALLLLPMGLGSGCATHKLWTTEELNSCNGPAPNTQLRLYQDGPQGNLVVLYDEYSERHDSVHARAYILDDNLQRIEDRRPPRFVSTNLVGGLTPVPIFSTTNIANPAPGFYAVVSTNHNAFTLHAGNQREQTYLLPVYDDGRGKVEKIALTPLTAAADATIVGGVLGAVWIAVLCESDTTIPPGKWR